MDDSKSNKLQLKTNATTKLQIGRDGNTYHDEI